MGRGWNYLLLTASLLSLETWFILEAVADLQPLNFLIVFVQLKRLLPKLDYRTFWEQSCAFQTHGDTPGCTNDLIDAFEYLHECDCWPSRARVIRGRLRPRPAWSLCGRLWSVSKPEATGTVRTNVNHTICSRTTITKERKSTAWTLLMWNANERLTLFGWSSDIQLTIRWFQPFSLTNCPNVPLTSQQPYFSLMLPHWSLSRFGAHLFSFTLRWPVHSDPSRGTTFDLSLNILSLNIYQIYQFIDHTPLKDRTCCYLFPSVAFLLIYFIQSLLFIGILDEAEKNSLSLYAVLNLIWPFHIRYKTGGICTVASANVTNLRDVGQACVVMIDHWQLNVVALQQ